MSISREKNSLLSRVVNFPLTRMIVGAGICWLAMVGTSNALRMIFRSEADVVKVIRWLLSMLVLFSVYYFFFKHYERRAITELSMIGMPRESLIGFLAGTLCISFVVGLLFLLGYFEVLFTTNVSALLLLLILFVTLSAFEELIFRGIIYRIIEESLGTNLALGISALLFGLAHLPNENANIISITSAIFGGLLAGLLFSLTRRLWLPIFFHAGWNWAQASLGVAVSGIDDLPGYLVSRLEGPELITGGAFGPENSIVTVLLVMILSGLAYYSTITRGNIVKRDDRKTSVLSG